MLHPEACWVGLQTLVKKTNIYNLETSKFVTYTRHFQKKHLAGVILGVTFGGNVWQNFFQKTIWREFFKKPFGGNNFMCQILAGTFSREHFGEKFEIFFFTSKTLQNAHFLNKGSEI